ncbi:pilus assembly protein TadG-related protein [Kitasatospora sp. NPDC001540]|uniref:pilus assembly protein TadG-related protein n=1 Tax=Kitasatospora sp. NPDC001540 TaxID=3364014 RepID=UPI0036B0A377
MTVFPADRPREEGGLSIFVAICVMALLALLGLVVDGGGKLKASERADAIAQEAARAGGQQLNAGKAIPGNGIEVDPAAARSAAVRYLEQAGFHGSYSIYPDQGNRVLVVDLTSTYTSIWGLGDMPVHGHATAALVYGVTAPKGP